MNGNAKFPTQDKSYFWKGRLMGLENVQRRPFYHNVLFYIYVLVLKKGGANANMGSVKILKLGGV